MSKKIFFGQKNQTTRLYSMSLEKGTGDSKPMYCIDIQAYGDQGSLLSFKEYLEERMRKNKDKSQTPQLGGVEGFCICSKLFARSAGTRFF